MPALIGEHFSPWSEKARWALDHHGVAYTYREHVPLLGEPLLRFRARRLTRRVSVPLLVTRAGPIPDSFAIARHAEQVGSGERLFPAEHEEQIAAWNARSEVALAAARALYLDRVMADREAKIEMQPPWLPLAVRRVSVPLADVAIGFLRRKYAVEQANTGGAEASLLRELEALRAALAAGGGPHLIDDRLSYADIAMAVTLQLVVPPAERFLALGPATRATCTASSIAARCPDLLAWRDALYERFRRR